MMDSDTSEDFKTKREDNEEDAKNKNGDDRNKEIREMMKEILEGNRKRTNEMTE